MTIGLIEKQIMWNRLLALVEEQAQVLQRTAFSTIVRESGDLAAGDKELAELHRLIEGQIAARQTAIEEAKAHSEGDRRKALAAVRYHRHDGSERLAGAGGHGWTQISSTASPPGSASSAVGCAM